MELLSVFTLWPRSAFRSRDITMYLVLSAFTSSPISLVATNNASAFKNHEFVSGLWRKITWTDRHRRSKTPRCLCSYNSNNYGHFVNEYVVKNMLHAAALDCNIWVTTAGPSPDCENWTCFASQWFRIVRSILGWPRKCYWIHTYIHTYIQNQ